MTLERFGQIVASYGAEPHRWPAAERDAAQAFLRENAEAQALCVHEATLDGMLGSYQVEPPGSALAARIIASAQRGSDRGLSWTAIIARAAGLAGIGATGAIAGAMVALAVVTGTPILPGEEDDQSMITAFDIPVDQLELDDIQ